MEGKKSITTKKNNFPVWIKNHSRGSSLGLYVQPGVSKNLIVGEFQGRLKLRLKAPPVDGAANEGLIAFLSELFGVPKSKVHLLRGEHSRQKTVLVELSPELVATALSQWC